MQSLKVLLIAGAGAGLVAGFAVACSSSSSGTPAPTPDAGTPVTTGDDAPESCLPLSPSELCSTAGQTCCLDFSMGIGPGVCEAPKDCTSNIQVQCISAAQCGANQVCCADFGGDGGTVAAFEDGGLGALGIDASAASTDAGLTGILGMLGNLHFNVSCQTACTGSQIQACASSAECNGGTCVALTALAGDAGGGIDASALTSGLGMYANTLGMEMACVPPASDAAAPPADAGTTPDAAPASDAAAPGDAGDAGAN
jgi:hypothetical protein